MTTPTATTLSELYEKDETAWLDRMAQLAAEGKTGELDLDNLSEFLTSMANRDRREVSTRLVALMRCLLIYELQPRRRYIRLRVKILKEHRELEMLLESATLRRFAASGLQETYREARKQAAAETSSPTTSLPEQCPWTVEDLLKDPEVA